VSLIAFRVVILVNLFLNIYFYFIPFSLILKFDYSIIFLLMLFVQKKFFFLILSDHLPCSYNWVVIDVISGWNNYRTFRITNDVAFVKA